MEVVLCGCPSAFPTSGPGSSTSKLLGYIFCAMMMRVRRSEVASELALRLEWARGKERAYFIENLFCNRKKTVFIKNVCIDCTWSRRRVVWCEPKWRHAAPLLLLSLHCCWAAELDDAPETLCTAHTAWGGSASPLPEREDRRRRRHGSVSNPLDDWKSRILHLHFERLNHS